MTEPLSEELFTRRGFSKDSDEEYSATIRNMKMQFYKGEFRDDLGTYIELRAEGQLRKTGYYHNDADFLTDEMFRNL